MPKMTQAEYIAHELRVAHAKRKAPENACLDEGELHGEIAKHCKMAGWICFHGTWGKLSRRTPGEPDFTILADKGRVFFIECKAKGGKFSTEQLGMKMWAEKLGHTIHTVYSFQDFCDVVTTPPSSDNKGS